LRTANKRSRSMKKKQLIIIRKEKKEMQKLFCLEGKGKRWKIMVFIHTCFQTWKEEKKSLLVSSRYNQRKVRKEEKLKLKIRLNYREKHCLNPQLHESEWIVFSQHVLVFLLITTKSNSIFIAFSYLTFQNSNQTFYYINLCWNNSERWGKITFCLH
jgi:hypothetical protein